MNKAFYSGFDYLRVFATFSVVWIHSADTSPFLTALNPINVYAVPCFVLMSIYLACQSLSQRKGAADTSYIWSRFKRLVYPLLIWSVVYLLARSLKGGGLSLSEMNISLLDVLSGGASYQLWFLPALFIYQLLVWSFLLRMPQSSFGRGITLAAIFVLSLFVPLVARQTFEVSFFGSSFLNNLVFVAIGMIAFYSLSRIFIRIRIRLFIVCTLLILAVVSAVLDRTYFVLTLSLFVFFCFFLFDYCECSMVKLLSKHSFGIFLIHGLHVEGGQFLLGRAGVDLQGTIVSSIFVLCVFGLSFSTSLILNSIPLVRRGHVLG